MPNIPERVHLEALADVNRRAAASGNKEALYASQKALGDELRKIRDATSMLWVGTNLSGINLSGYPERILCLLDSFRLEDANLSLVNFSGSYFSNIGFHRTIFDRTMMMGASFSNCDFDQAVIDAADFRDVRFSRCLFVYATFGQYPQVDSARMPGSLVSRPFYDYLKGRLSGASLPRVRD